MPRFKFLARSGPFPTERMHLFLSLLLITLAGTQPALAQQMYRCTGPTGHTSLSDKPCPVTGNPLQQYGGAPEYRPQRAYSPPPARVGEVQPHHQHLPTAACKDLSEALRTGAARGVGAEGMRNLRKEWDERCRDDEAQAMQIYQERQRLEREKKDQARRAVASNSGPTPEQKEQQAELERCTELRRILDKRRERLDLTPGEKSDLNNFEKNYQSRCGKPD